MELDFLGVHLKEINNNNGKKEKKNNSNWILLYFEWISFFEKFVKIVVLKLRS